MGRPLTRAIAIITYDYLITYDREVRHIWRRRFGVSALLFYAVRYSGLSSAILFTLYGAPFHGKSSMVCGWYDRQIVD